MRARCSTSGSPRNLPRHQRITVLQRVLAAGHGGDLANPGRAEIGLVPFSPLGNGFLAGTVRSTTTFTDGIAQQVPRLTGKNPTANATLVEHVNGLGARTSPRAGCPLRKSFGSFVTGFSTCASRYWLSPTCARWTVNGGQPRRETWIGMRLPNGVPESFDKACTCHPEFLKDVLVRRAAIRQPGVGESNEILWISAWVGKSQECPLQFCASTITPIPPMFT
ncbi:hypothetical protein JOJ86_004940 [Rhodococcus percolatus]|nr:hypothetical protein [Rhodococcus opacus]MBP2207214.1 hypothetical protein [Rhodococcus opacus]